MVVITNVPESDEVMNQVGDQESRQCRDDPGSPAEVHQINGAVKCLGDVLIDRRDNAVLRLRLLQHPRQRRGLIAADDRTQPENLQVQAEPPKIASHRKAIEVGTNIAPNMNSRMVRPREMRAMNMPTKGAQEIHQPQ